MSIGAVSERTGVSTSALRYYEAEGLVSSERSDGGQRRFHRDALGEDRVGPHREVTVLFGGADRQHDPVIVFQVFLEHLPVAVMDSHLDLPKRGDPRR